MAEHGADKRSCEAVASLVVREDDDSLVEVESPPRGAEAFAGNPHLTRLARLDVVDPLGPPAQPAITTASLREASYRRTSRTVS
jgi:hypothetical protein